MSPASGKAAKFAKKVILSIKHIGILVFNVYLIKR